MGVMSEKVDPDLTPPPTPAASCLAGPVEIPARTGAEMRELDRRAAAEFGVPTLVLMENAGRSAADVAAAMAAPRDGAVLVFCGKGNNGGDGFVLARHLANRGHDVRCYFAAALAEVDPRSDAGVNLGIARKLGIRIYEHGRGHDRESMARRVPEVALFVDALLGTGLAGPVREPFLGLIDFLNARRAPILALDVPSGLDADSGEPLGRAVHARKTVTFGAPKVGFAAPGAGRYTGEVVVGDISMPRALLLERRR